MTLRLLGIEGVLRGDRWSWSLPDGWRVAIFPSSASPGRLTVKVVGPPGEFYNRVDDLAGGVEAAEITIMANRTQARAA